MFCFYPMEEQSRPLLEFSPQNPKKPEIKAPNFDEQRHNHIMGKLKGAIFATLSASNASRSISQELKCHIERRLHEFFPRSENPTHPPYALMIQTAIKELNEVGGSIEASISGYIEKNYRGLPWGHATFLRHHLRKLSRTGEIMCKIDGRYMIAVDQGREEEECRVEGKEDVMVNEWNKEREKQFIVFEKRCKVEKLAGEEKTEESRQDTEATEQAVKGLNVLLNDEEKSNLEYQHIEMNEEPSHLQELQFEVSDKRALACVQQDLVIVEQSMAKEVLLEVIHEKNEFQEQLLENSHSLEGMGLTKHDPPKLIMVEEKKHDLRVEQQQQAKSPCTERATAVEVTEGEKHFQEHEDRFIGEENQTHDRPEAMMEEEKKVELKVEQKQHTRSPCTERASDVEAVEGEKQLQVHHIEGEMELLGLSCVNKKDRGKNSWVSLVDSSLSVFKRQRKQWQQLQEQRKMSIWEENNFVIVCGLQAQQLAEPRIYVQQKAPNSRPDNKQQQQSQDTTMAVLLPSGQQLDVDFHNQQHLECQDQGTPSNRKGDGDRNGSLRIYVRRRRRA